MKYILVILFIFILIIVLKNNNKLYGGQLININHLYLKKCCDILHIKYILSGRYMEICHNNISIKFKNGLNNLPRRIQYTNRKVSVSNIFIVKMFLKNGERLKEPSIIQRVKVARRHLEMSILWKGEILGVLETRRHYSNYFKAIPDFKKFRTGLVTANSSIEVFNLLNQIEQKAKLEKEIILD